jgi:hypothetical protein
VLMVEFMQQRTTITSEVYCKTLKKLRRAGYSENKVWNADIRCNVPPWHCASEKHLLSLKHCWRIATWSCLTTLLTALISLRATIAVYLYEELVVITALQK